jgi:hypothetical protein
VSGLEQSEDIHEIALSTISTFSEGWSIGVARRYYRLKSKRASDGGDGGWLTSVTLFG